MLKERIQKAEKKDVVGLKNDIDMLKERIEELKKQRSLIKTFFYKIKDN